MVLCEVLEAKIGGGGANFTWSVVLGMAFEDVVLWCGGRRLRWI